MALVPHVWRYLRGRRAEPTDLERKELRRLSLKDLHYLGRDRALRGRRQIFAAALRELHKMQAEKQERGG